MKSIDFSFILICVSLVSTGISQEPVKDCELIGKDGEKLSYFDWYMGIDFDVLDTAKPGTNIAKFETENIDNIDTVWDVTETNNGWQSKRTYPIPSVDYLDFDFVDNIFYINLNEYFADFEEYETKTLRRVQVAFYCNGYETNRDIVFIFSINDTNNHPPKFMGAPYKFNLPMPILKGYGFEAFGEIIARDVDLTNKNVTFAFNATDENSKGFSIVSKGEAIKKNYTAQFMASETIDLEEDVIFAVYATDSDKPALTSNTTITITIDKENSAPRFSHVLYFANLTNLTNIQVKEITVNFTQGNIILARGYEGVRSFEILGVSEENKKHLNLTRYNINLELKLVNLTKEFLIQRTLSFTVMAVKDKVKAETAIHILLPVAKSKSEETIDENDSISGFVITTILMSLILIGVAGYLLYFLIDIKMIKTICSLGLGTQNTKL